MTTWNVVLVSALAIGLTGCATTRIGRIVADPTHYRNRTVTVEGRVTASVGAFVAGGYQVEDETGKLYVISTSSGVPKAGTQVKVTGNVTPGVTLMGQTMGTVLREHKHRVHY